MTTHRERADHAFALGVMGLCVVSRGFRLLTFVVIGALVLVMGVVFFNWTHDGQKTPSSQTAAYQETNFFDQFEDDGFVPYKPPEPRQYRKR
jgi:hypothetical protein